MMFKTIGFLIKPWPWKGAYTVDAEPDYKIDAHRDFSANLISRGLLQKNYLEFLEPTSPLNIHTAIQEIEKTSNFTIIKISAQSIIAEYLAFEQKISPHLLWGEDIEFTKVGYDIIDSDGWFTFLNHPYAIELRGTEDLFPMDKLEEAKTMQELAGYIAPDHSPYWTVEVQVKFK